MKRMILVLLLVGALTEIVSPQVTRQAVTPQAAADPRVSIDEAVAQLKLLDGSHERLMDTAGKMASASAALYIKIYAVCGMRDKITSPDAVKAVNELCTSSTQWQQQAATLQMQMQNENRQYTTVSNVLKTRHDTVKNSIGNIR